MKLQGAVAITDHQRALLPSTESRQTVAGATRSPAAFLWPLRLTRAASLPLRQYGSAHTHMRSHGTFMPANLNAHKRSRARFLPPRASTISPPPADCRVYNSAATSLPIRTGTGTERQDLPSTYNPYVRLPSRKHGTPSLIFPGHVSSPWRGGLRHPQPVTSPS